MSASLHPVAPRHRLNSPTPATAVSRSAPQRLAVRLLVLWHLVSLDAPTVAAVWVVFIAGCAGVALGWAEPAAMFVAVWVLYAGDRLLDGRCGSQERELEARHRFHRRHRSAFYLCLMAAGLLLACLLSKADSAATRLELILGCLLLAWMLIIHLRPVRAARLPKELAVGIFFPAAVFIPTVARMPALRPVLLPVAMLFAVLCSLNCLFIHTWEHPYSSSYAHASTRWAGRRLRGLTFVAVCLALFMAASYSCSTKAIEGLALPALACALSACLLFLLHKQKHRMRAVTLRAAADLCLLTPLLLLPRSSERFASSFRPVQSKPQILTRWSLRRAQEDIALKR